MDGPGGPGHDGEGRGGLLSVRVSNVEGFVAGLMPFLRHTISDSYICHQGMKACLLHLGGCIWVVMTSLHRQWTESITRGLTFAPHESIKPSGMAILYPPSHLKSPGLSPVERLSSNPLPFVEYLVGRTSIFPPLATAEWVPRSKSRRAERASTPGPCVASFPAPSRLEPIIAKSRRLPLKAHA